MARSGPTVATCLILVVIFGMYALFVRQGPTTVATKVTPYGVSRTESIVKEPIDSVPKANLAAAKGGSFPAEGTRSHPGEAVNTDTKLPVSSADKDKRLRFGPSLVEKVVSLSKDQNNLKTSGDKIGKLKTAAGQFMAGLNENQQAKRKDPVINWNAIPSSQKKEQQSGQMRQKPGKGSNDGSSASSSVSSGSASYSYYDSSYSLSDYESSLSDYVSESSSDTKRHRDQRPGLQDQRVKFAVKTGPQQSPTGEWQSQKLKFNQRDNPPAIGGNRDRGGPDRGGHDRGGQNRNTNKAGLQTRWRVGGNK